MKYFIFSPSRYLTGALQSLCIILCDVVSKHRDRSNMLQFIFNMSGLVPVARQFPRSVEILVFRCRNCDGKRSRSNVACELILSDARRNLLVSDQVSGALKRQFSPYNYR